MRDIYEQFREQSEHLTVTPHERAWDRVKSKLHAHRGHRKFVFARFVSIAAVMLLFVAISVIVMLSSEKQTFQRAAAYTMSIEALQIVDDSESIFDVEKIRKSYADLELSRN